MSYKNLKEVAEELVTESVIVKGKKKTILDEMILSLILLAMSTAWLLYTLMNGMTDMQVLSFILFKSSLLMSLGSVFVRFLNGIGYNINEEIFTQHNISAAIYVGLAWVAIAITIALGNLG